MATATSPTAPQFVQQAFNWDELESASLVVKAPADSTAKTVHGGKSRSLPPTAQTFSTSRSARRGRCEHVGGILASVLERYGIGIDDLVAEIDALK